MKCPKCDYTSFDYLDKCGRCGFDLTGLRDRFGFSAEKGEGLDILNYMSSNDESSLTDQPSADYKEEKRLPRKNEEVESPEVEIIPDKVPLENYPEDTATEQTITVENAEIHPVDTAGAEVQDDFNLADFTFTPPSSEPSLKENEVELSLDTVQGLELDNAVYPDLLSGPESGLEMKMEDLSTLGDLDSDEISPDEIDSLSLENKAGLGSGDISLDDIDNLNLDDIDIVPPK